MPRRGQFKDRSGEIIGNRKLLKRDLTRGVNSDGHMREPYYLNECLTCGYVGSNGISSINKVKDSTQCTKCMNRLHRRAVDIKGKTFGEWKVIGHTRRLMTPGGSYYYLAECRCSCGTKRDVPVYNLIRGLTKSCGCLQKINSGCHGKSQTPSGKLFVQRRIEAKKQGIPFTISIDDVVVPEFCPVLGIKIEPGRQGKGKGIEDNSPSLDKFIPELGYVPGNIAVISWRANRLKHNATTNELEKVVNWMKEFEANMDLDEQYQLPLLLSS